MSAMFELCRLRCEYAELHAPSSFGLDELLIIENLLIFFAKKPPKIVLWMHTCHVKLTKKTLVATTIHCELDWITKEIKGKA